MKTTITTYDKEGNVIVSRDYNFLNVSSEDKINALESILEDSHTYLEEQALDNGEHEHADSVDADGTCLECGKTDLI
jgi:hypothetical protein